MGDLIGSSLYRLANRNVALEADLARLRAENEALRTELGEAKFTISNYRQWDRLSFDCAIADKNRDLETAKTAIAAAEAKAARLETALRDTINLAEAQNATLVAWHGIGDGGEG